LKEKFAKKYNPDAKSRTRIAALDALVTEYMAAGRKLTSRHAFYKLVTKNMVENNENTYKSITRLINLAKIAGLLDWAAFEDLQRPVQGDTSDPVHTPYVIDIRSAVQREIDTCFMSERWANQPYYVEVGTEKNALMGIIGEAARDGGVAYFATRGYTSGQALYEASKRFRGKINLGRKCVLLYVGDHDSSGEDMVRDIQNRLDIFGVGDVEVKKIALTLEQVRQYDLPPQALKGSDTRSAGYQEKYGINECWEADALEPDVLVRLVQDAITTYFDEGIYQANQTEKSEYIEQQWEKYSQILTLIDDQTA
jgi:hypothetical protein